MAVDGDGGAPQRGRAASAVIYGGKWLITAAIALLFLVVPGRLLYENFADSAGAQELSSPAPTLTPPVGSSHYGTPVGVYLRKRPGLCLTFEFLGLDPANSFAAFGIQVGVTNRGKRLITRFEHGKQPQGRKKTKGPAPRYKDISLVVKSGIGLNSVVIPIRASTLEAAHPSTCGTGDPTTRELGQLDRYAAFRTTQNILVLGQPRAFPQDWYEAYESVAMLAGHGTFGEALPASLIVTSQDGDLSTGVHLDGPPAQQQPKTDELMFIIRRPSLIIEYTYLLGMLLLILPMGALIYAYGAKKLGDISQVALGIAGTLVAILPLRAVLVPNSIPGLTRLDILFGSGITLLVILTALMFMWPRSRE